MPLPRASRATGEGPAYPRSVIDGLTLALLVSGLVLFVVGDILWFARHMRDRSMDLRMTGGLVGAGVLLIGIGMLRILFGG